MLSDPDAARLGLLVMYAMDMFTGMAGKHSLTPPADQRLAADGWRLVGHIIGTDAIYHTRGPLGLSDQDVFYGFLAENIAAAGNFVAVIRGTDGIVEWIEDAEFQPVGYARQPGCKVEQGFWGIYETMQLIGADDHATRPLADDIARRVGAKRVGAKRVGAGRVGAGRVTVVGHSLGSALATYLTLDLGLGALGNRVEACLFASPRTGDQEFVALFDRTVPTYKLYNYVLDVVPRVPSELIGFLPLPRATLIAVADAQAAIRVDVGCNHHVICYGAMLDFAGSPYKHVPEQDSTEAACIIGLASPNSVAALLEKAIRDLPG